MNKISIRRLLTILSVLSACLMVATSCSGQEAGADRVEGGPLLRVQLDGPDGSEAVSEEDRDLALQIIEGLTTEQKIGQLFVPVVYGKDPNTVSADERQRNMRVFGVGTPAEIIERYQLGGVMYLAGNVDDSTQVGTLTSGLQDEAANAGAVPLLIAIDQEGGRVNRITEGVTVAPSAAELSGDVDAVREASATTAEEVSVLGVNVVLAPVADLSEPDAPGVIGNRSFGDDPTQTSEMVTAAIEGLQSSDIAAAVKHWPGHGATNVDSHLKKPLIELSKSEWQQSESLPFEAALGADVQIVLVGHLAFPAFGDSTDVATVSNALVEELLREEFGFDGLVMSDALNMGAVADFEQGELGVRAIEAGIDTLLYPENMVEMHEGVTEAVSSGRISAERLDQSVLRILTLKSSLGLLDDYESPDPSPDQESVPESTTTTSAPRRRQPQATTATTVPGAPNPSEENADTTLPSASETTT